MEALSTETDDLRFMGNVTLKSSVASLTCKAIFASAASFAFCTSQYKENDRFPSSGEAFKRPSSTNALPPSGFKSALLDTSAARPCVQNADLISLVAPTNISAPALNAFKVHTSKAPSRLTMQRSASLYEGISFITRLRTKPMSHWSIRDWNFLSDSACRLLHFSTVLTSFLVSSLSRNANFLPNNFSAGPCLFAWAAAAGTPSLASASVMLLVFIA